MKKEYPSAVDSWLGAILIGAPLVVVAFGIFTLTKSISAGTVVIAVGVLIGGAIAAFSIPCVYTLSDDSLKIRCGLLEDEVPLGKIRKAEKSGSAWSAPALSMKRVRVILDDGCRVISPKDRDGFISDLVSRLKHENSG
jgi:hypothetical protein